MMQSTSAATPIAYCDKDGKAILSGRDKKLKTVQKEVMQLLRKHNLSAADAIGIIESCKGSISQIAMEKLF